MSKITILSFFLFLSINMFSQNKNLSINYQSTYIGQDFTTLFSFDKDKNTIYIGASYFMNSEIKDYVGYLYKNRFQANSLSDRIGGLFGYSRKIQLNNSDLTFSPFLQYQFNYMGLKNYLFLFQSTDSTGRDIFEAQRIDIEKNILVISQTLGIELGVKFYKKIHLTTKIGNQNTLVFNNPNITGLRKLDRYEKFDIEILGFYFNVGLSYLIN